MTLSSVAACDNGHWGPDCIHPCNCSAGHGSCDAVSGLCLCEAGYEGAQCEQCEYRPGTRTSPLSVHTGMHVHMTTLENTCSCTCVSVCTHAPECSGARNHSCSCAVSHLSGEQMGS